MKPVISKTNTTTCFVKIEEHELIWEHSDALKKLLATCPCEDKQEFSEYNEGGYDYYARTDYWKQCSLCGKVSDFWTKKHGYFG